MGEFEIGDFSVQEGVVNHAMEVRDAFCVLIGYLYSIYSGRV